MVFGGGAEELELRVVLLSLAESHQKVFTIFGTILSSVLDNGLIPLRQLFRQFSDVLLGVWLFKLHEDLRE